MSEKLKPNFTPVPNVIFDEAMRTLAPGAVKVLFAICRFTYGWGKQSDRISLNQLAEMTGLERSNVHRAVKQLGGLVIVTSGDPRRNQASEYRLNLEIPEVELVSIRQQGLVSPRQQPVVRPVVTSATIQRKPKKEDKKRGAKAPESSPIKRSRKPSRGVKGIPPELQPTVSKIVGRMNELAGTHYHDDKPGALRNLLAQLNEGLTEGECLAVVEGRYSAWNGSGMMEYFRPSTLFAEAHFEDYLQAAQRHASNSHAKPAKDLGDGLVEVDGRRMEKTMYERRYGPQAAN